MNKFQVFLAKPFLQWALGRPSPERIPRSGQEGAAVNCVSFRVDKDAKPYLWVSALVGTKLHAEQFDGDRYSTPVEVDLRDLDGKDFHFVHYYGLASVTYSGLWDLVWGRIAKIPYIKIRTHRTLESISQYFFNKKRLVAKKRVELLKLMVEKRIEGEGPMMTMEVAIAMYSLQWILHPGKDEHQKELELYLESLVASGDLVKTKGYLYEATGSAIQTIERYEEEEARHVENVRMQRFTVALTFAIAILTVIQAGIVKLPILLDLSR